VKGGEGSGKKKGEQVKATKNPCDKEKRHEKVLPIFFTLDVIYSLEYGFWITANRC
jgi:hypothetical protein